MQVSFTREFINASGTTATEWFLIEGYKTIKVQGITTSVGGSQLQVLTTNVEERPGVPLNSSALNAGGGAFLNLANTWYQTPSGAQPICWKWCKVQISQVAATNRTIVVTLQD